MSLKDYDITVTVGDKSAKMSGEEFDRIANKLITNMDTSSIIAPRETRSLRYDFTAPETHELAMQLANKLQEIEAVKDQKKSAQAKHDATIKTLTEEINKLSKNVSQGHEYRDVECTVEYHKPEQGKKTLTRNDGGAVIIEKMQQFEWNLFNQVNDTVDDALQDEAHYTRDADAYVAVDDKPKRKGKAPVSKKTEELFKDPNDLHDIL